MKHGEYNTDIERKEETRRRNKPESISVLFVGESIPAGRTFFYDANSNLYRATAKAFNEIYGCEEGGNFLKRFKKLGCYLDDLCREPVNKLDDPEERKNKREKSVHDLAKRIREMRPRAIVAVMKGISYYVCKAVKEASLSYRVDFRGELSFPAWRHRPEYIVKLKKVLKEFIKKGILQPPENM